MRTALILILLTAWIPYFPIHHSTYSPSFDGVAAMTYLEAQCEFGPRPPGSENLSQCREYLVHQLEASGWVVQLQNFTYQETPCANIIAKDASPNQSRFILGAHYDTRPRADQDPSLENRSFPVLGANDGASGVSVLLELANSIPAEIRPIVELVLFDAEDSGGIGGWEWIVGSTKYVELLDQEERSNILGMILADMVGDESLRIPLESTSTDSLQNAIWELADELGYGDIFLDVTGGSILDDHRPFLSADIPAVDLIHYPFPWYWHTREDTPDKCSAESLEAVGRVIEYFIFDYQSQNTDFTPDTGVPLQWIIAISAFLAVAIFVAYKRR